MLSLLSVSIKLTICKQSLSYSGKKKMFSRHSCSLIRNITDTVVCFNKEENFKETVFKTDMYSNVNLSALLTFKQVNCNEL